jgi:hypothetical protein
VVFHAKARRAFGEMGGKGVGGIGWWWVVVLADGAGCGMVPDSDPMSARRREIPRAGAVVSLPVGKQLRAYVLSLKGSAAFWLYDSLTTEIVGLHNPNP